jgi:hypothetical protein
MAEGLSGAQNVRTWPEETAVETQDRLQPSLAPDWSASGFACPPSLR